MTTLLSSIDRVHVRWMPDPLSKDRDEVFDAPWIGDDSIASYATMLGIPTDREVVARVNGMEFSRDAWGGVVVTKGDRLDFATPPRGTELLVAAIVLSVGSTIYSLASASGAVQEAPGVVGQGFDQRSSDGLQTNENPEGDPIPIHYGEVITSASVIERTTEHIGGSVVRKGHVHASFGGQRSLTVYGVGEGPVQSVGGITTDRDNLAIGDLGPRGALYDWRAHTPTGPIAMATTAAGPTAIHRIAWRFQALTDTYVTEIRIKMRRFQRTPATSVTGDLRVRIEGNTSAIPTAGVPNGVTAHSEVGVPMTAINTGSYEDQLFELALPVPLIGTTQPYQVVLEANYPVSADSYVEVAYIHWPGAVSNMSLHGGSGESWRAPTGSLASAIALGYVASLPEQYQGDGIRVGGTPIQHLGGPTFVSVRRGGRDQEPLPHLMGVVDTQQVATDLYYDNPILITSNVASDGFGVQIAFPNGYYHQRRTGQRQPANFRLLIRWRASGMTSWAGEQLIDEGGLQFETANAAEFRVPFERGGAFAQLRGQIIDVQVTYLLPTRGFNGPTAVRWETLEVYGDTDAQSHPHLVLVALDMPVGQSPGEPRTFRIVGKLMWYCASLDGSGNPIFTYGYTDNPIDIIHDLATNPRYGGGRQNRWGQRNIDYESLVDARNWCNELIFDSGAGRHIRRWVVGVSVDLRRPVYEWCQAVAASCATKLVVSGSVMKFKPNRPREKVDVLTDADILPGSFSKKRTSIRRRPNRVHVHYFDNDADGTKAYQPAEDPDARIAADDVITEDVTSIGIRDAHRAGRLAQRLLKHGRLRRETIKWTSFIRSATLEVGDVVGIQSSVPRWEQIGGRVIEGGGGGNALRVDRALTIDDTGDPYWLTYWTTDDVTGIPVVVSRQIDRGAGPFPITIDAGDWIDTLTSFPANQHPKAGNSYAIRPVRAEDPNEIGVKLFEITRARLNADFRMEFEALEYDERAYEDDPGAVSSRSTKGRQFSKNDIPPSPRDLHLIPTVNDDDQYTVRASFSPVTWGWPYKIAVFVRQENVGIDRWHPYGTIDSSQRSIDFVDVAPNQTYSVSLCAIAAGTADHRYTPGSQFAATATVTVRADQNRPDSVTGLAVAV